MDTLDHEDFPIDPELLAPGNDMGSLIAMGVDAPS